MTQPADWGVPSVGPATPTAYASRDNGSFNALLDLHSGTSRPAYAVDGTVWKDVVSGTEENIYFFDGTDDILLYTINPTANTVAVANAISSILEDTSPQLGGFLDPNGNYIGMATGGDIVSANPLVVDADGDSFDVTGTTGHASMTVEANRHFFTQYDGILTITHGGSQSLPGGANITTAAGDVAEWVSTAANTVRCVNYTKADGTAVVSAGGGAWTFLSEVTVAAAASASIETTWSATYDQYAIIGTNIVSATGSCDMQMQLKIGGSYSTGGSYYTSGYSMSGSSYVGFADSGATSSAILKQLTNFVDAPSSMVMFFTSGDPTSSATKKTAGWTGHGAAGGTLCGGSMREAINTGALTGAKFFTSTAENFKTATFRLYGINNS